MVCYSFYDFNISKFSSHLEQYKIQILKIKYRSFNCIVKKTNLVVLRYLNTRNYFKIMNFTKI